MNRKIRSIAAVLLVIVMVFTMVACSSTAPATGGSSNDTGGSSTPAVEATDDEELVFAYFALTMVSQWLQNIDKALNEIGAERGFRVINADANFDAETQLSQMDTLITGGLDGAVVFMADEGAGPAVAAKMQASGVPFIGETLRIQDENHNLLAPVVELDAYGVGKTGADWLIENCDEQGLDSSDFSKTGYISLTNSAQESALLRGTGFDETFFGAMKDFPDANKFTSDVASEATSADDTDATYKLVSAIVGAQPSIEKWLIFSAYDDLAVGACRAIEAAGKENDTVLIDIGGERGIPEWKAGNAPEWKACVYFSAMDFAIPLVDAIFEMRAGTDPKNIFPDLKEAGQEYSSYKITGTVVTPDTYEGIYLEGY